MMKLVIGTEAMFFLSLIMAFVYFSLSPAFKHLELTALDIRSTGLFSLFLFASSFTYWQAERHHRKGKKRGLQLWLVATIVLGLVFLSGQAKEYHSLLGKDIHISSNTFGTSFFTLTGFHGLHVLIGLIVIGIITGLSFTDDQFRGGSVISTVGRYWHFVDLVWVVVFLVVYVKPYFL